MNFNSNTLQNKLLGLDALTEFGVNYKNDPYYNPDTGYSGGEVLNRWVEQTSDGGCVVHKIDVADNGRDEYDSIVTYDPEGRITSVDSFKSGELPTLFGRDELEEEG